MIHFRPEVRELYRVTTNSDLTEGRGATVHIGYFTNHADAVKAAEGRGVMGSNGSVEKLKDSQFPEISIFESYREYDTKQLLNAKESALRKLTYDEKRALGLA